MLIVAKGTATSISNPVLVFYGRSKGLLIDVAELSFQIWSGGSQLFPALSGSKQAVNVTTDRLGLGRFAATWTVPSASGTALGRYEVRWFSKETLSSPEVESRETFEVVATLDVSGPFYAGPTDLAGDEAVAGVATTRMLLALGTAGRMLEAFTRTWFEPRYIELGLDGKGGPTLHLQHAVVAIGEVLLDGDAVDLADVVVYNRHLLGVTSPDDRRNPKLVWTGAWPRGAQNIEVRGVLGTTEKASVAWGVTPSLARHATKLIAIRELGVMGDAEIRDQAQNRYRMVSESTRDQSYTMASRQTRGGPAYFTGDPEIDQMIVALRGPMQVGST